MSDLTEIARVAVPESLITKPESFGGRRVDGCRMGNLQLRHGVVVGMTGSEDPPERVVMPKLTEPHVHLDKCHTIERLGPIGGDLAVASAAQLKDKERWNAEDLETRMRRGLCELAASGCGYVRTHIDWHKLAHPPPAWDVACGLRAEAREMGIELQVAALVGIDQMANPDFAAEVTKRVAADGGVLGCFVLHHSGREDGLRTTFALADQYGLALDFHVDEGLNPELGGLTDILRISRETGFAGPVLCGHACSLSVKSEAEVEQIAENLAEGGLSIVSLPTTNLYLQGRRDGTPRARGLTMIHELQAAGVNVSLGSDNVRDAYCPVGVHDPLNSLSLAILTAHLDPPMASHLPMITSNALGALGLAPQMIDGAKTDDLILFDVPDLTTLLSTRPRPRTLAAFIQGDLAND